MLLGEIVVFAEGHGVVYSKELGTGFSFGPDDLREPVKQGDFVNFYEDVTPRDYPKATGITKYESI